MIKNIVLGVVLASISAGLIYGAVTRTQLRGAVGISADEGNIERGGKNRAGTTPDGEPNSGQGNLYEKDSQDNSNRQGQAGNALGSGLADVEDIYQYEGTVQEVTDDSMAAAAEPGSQIVMEMENRAWWYALESGFNASIGDEVVMRGFYDESGVFEVVSIENLTQGISVQVREESGRPLWAGNGKRR